MPSVQLTSHLYRYFPELEQREIIVPAGSVAEVLHALDNMAPGIRHYILDDNGALRRHVNISINNAVLVDRKSLADYVPDEATVYIFQALTGG